VITVRTLERPAEAADAEAALSSIDAHGGVWLGCDVLAPGLFSRDAKAALDPLLALYLDGCVLKVVPHGDVGRALAARLAELARFDTVQGRLEICFDTSAATPHPVVTLLRCFLAGFSSAPGEFGLYGTLAFDYFRLTRGDTLPDDGRRRLALFLPARVLCTGGAGHRWVEFSFPELQPLAGGQACIEPVVAHRFEDDLPPGGHAAAVARGVERLQRGDLCSLVLSQTFRRKVNVNAPHAFAQLRRDNPYPAMFFANLGGGEKVFGASPDIQVRADTSWVETSPVCGTFRRGADPVDDHEQAKALMNSLVDEASLALCADSDRNDKALVCEPGTVELLSRRRLHFFSTIIHTIDHIRGRRRASVDGFDIVLAHATPATVTGMPKALARDAIADIEAEWRGWYAGAAVRIGADGSCEALTMLRFARLLGEWAEVRTGGSLLADSDPPREEEETRLKAQTMFRVLAGLSPHLPVNASAESPLESPALAATAAPAPRTAVHFIDGGAALAALQRETLVQAGCDFADDASIEVWGDGPLEACRRRAVAGTRRPALLLNNAALAQWQHEGATLQRLDTPQFGRSLDCHAVAGGLLDAMGAFSVGIHATYRALVLPPGWLAAAIGADGRIVAAVHPSRRLVALAFRPDSVLSLRHAAGRSALRASLRWLATPAL